MKAARTIVAVAVAAIALLGHLNLAGHNERSRVRSRLVRLFGLLVLFALVRPKSSLGPNTFTKVDTFARSVSCRYTPNNHRNPVTRYSRAFTARFKEGTGVGSQI